MVSSNWRLLRGVESSGVRGRFMYICHFGCVDEGTSYVFESILESHDNVITISASGALVQDMSSGDHFPPKFICWPKGSAVWVVYPSPSVRPSNMILLSGRPFIIIGYMHSQEESARWKSTVDSDRKLSLCILQIPKRLVAVMIPV